MSTSNSERKAGGEHCSGGDTNPRGGTTEEHLFINGKPNHKVRLRHLLFINSNWPALAAEVYSGFLHRGRGMLLMYDGDFINKPLGTFCKFACVYVAEGTPEFAILGNRWPGRKETKWIAEYDPKQGALLCFLRTDNGTSCYRITGLKDSTPELLYQRATAKKN